MSRRRPWRWPSAIAVLTLLGLLSALLGEGGVWSALSWVALSVPLLVAAVAGRRAVSRRRSSGT